MTKKQPESAKLYQIVQAIVVKRQSQIELSPTWIATEALIELEARELQKTHSLVYQAAHLQFRQIAREYCRSTFDPADKITEAAQHSLFPALQSRYPRAHAKDVEATYLPLEHLSEKDVRWNIDRLRAEADAKLEHADALEAWWQQRAAA